MWTAEVVEFESDQYRLQSIRQVVCFVALKQGVQYRQKTNFSGEDPRSWFLDGLLFSEVRRYTALLWLPCLGFQVQGRFDRRMDTTHCSQNWVPSELHWCRDWTGSVLSANQIRGPCCGHLMTIFHSRMNKYSEPGVRVWVFKWDSSKGTAASIPTYDGSFSSSIS